MIMNVIIETMIGVIMWWQYDNNSCEHNKWMNKNECEDDADNDNMQL